MARKPKAKVTKEESKELEEALDLDSFIEEELGELENFVLDEEDLSVKEEETPEELEIDSINLEDITFVDEVEKESQPPKEEDLMAALPKTITSDLKETLDQVMDKLNKIQEQLQHQEQRMAGLFAEVGQLNDKLNKQLGDNVVPLGESLLKVSDLLTRFLEKKNNGNGKPKQYNIPENIQKKIKDYCSKLNKKVKATDLAAAFSTKLEIPQEDIMEFLKGEKLISVGRGGYLKVAK